MQGEHFTEVSGKEKSACSARNGVGGAEDCGQELWLRRAQPFEAQGKRVPPLRGALATDSSEEAEFPED